MPFIDIAIAQGRSAEKVAELIRLVTDTVERWDDIPRGDISVMVRQIPRDHWATGGVTIAERAGG